MVRRCCLDRPSRGIGDQDDGCACNILLTVIVDGALDHPALRSNNDDKRIDRVLPDIEDIRQYIAVIGSCGADVEVIRKTGQFKPQHAGCDIRQNKCSVGLNAGAETFRIRGSAIVVIEKKNRLIVGQGLSAFGYQSALDLRILSQGDLKVCDVLMAHLNIFVKR